MHNTEHLFTFPKCSVCPLHPPFFPIAKVSRQTREQLVACIQYHSDVSSHLLVGGFLLNYSEMLSHFITRLDTERSWNITSFITSMFYSLICGNCFKIKVTYLQAAIIESWHTCDLTYLQADILASWHPCKLTYLQYYLLANWSTCKLTNLQVDIHASWHTCNLIYLKADILASWSMLKLISLHADISTSWHTYRLT